MNPKLLSTLISLGTLLGIAFGTYFWMENRFALAQNLNLTNQRLDYKMKSDQVKEIRARIWQLEDRCIKLCDLTSKEEMRKLNADLEDAQVQLRTLEKK